jgi:hypothetical protein
MGGVPEMSERWIPVLSAVVGVIGGLGGAVIGGYVANEGQEQRFHDERAAHVQDLRRDRYVNYVRELIKLTVVGGVPVQASTAQTEVDLLSSSRAVQRAARELGEAAGELNEAMKQGDAPKEARTFSRKLDRFIEVAHKEVESGA